MIIIPARIDSSRFPRKVLADVAGLPMVVRTARAVCEVDETVVATDSEEVAKVCDDYGIRSVMTGTAHQSGTDRIDEAAARLGLADDAVVINVQADEPFIEPEVIARLMELVQHHRHDTHTMICSLYRAVTPQQAEDPNLVKVVTNESGYALYFSRSRIPFDRDGGYDGYKGHLGLYGFTRRMLARFCALPPSQLERTEKLEQLRALSHGYRIAMAEVETESFGIDTPEDLARALEMSG